MEKEKINFIHGCMFAGKSKTIIENIDLKKPYIAIKPAIHTRDGEFIKSRVLKEKIPCILTDDPRILTKVDTEQYIIDEYQFFNPEMLQDTLVDLKKKNKTVLIAGLDKLDTGRYWNNFEMVKKLSDRLIKLKADCDYCKKKNSAEFSICEKLKQANVDINAVYHPACPECFTQYGGKK